MSTKLGVAGLQLTPQQKGRVVGFLTYQVAETAALTLATDGLAASAIPARVSEKLATLGEKLLKMGVSRKAIDRVVVAFERFERWSHWKKAPDAPVGPTLPNTTRGWTVGQPINNLTAQGNVPSWTAVRQRFWKNEAHLNPGNYNVDNLARMQRGLAPQRVNPRTGQLESMELHHTPPQRDGGLFDVRPVWPDDHALIDPFRQTGK